MIAFIGGLIGGAMAMGGAALSRKFMKKEAQRDRDFQERMSSSAYSRSMDDMRGAGLNPILAYKQGGASTPGGSTAQVPDFSKVGASAMQGHRLTQEMKNMRATEGLTGSQTEAAVQQAASTAQDVKKMKIANQLARKELNYWNEHPTSWDARMGGQAAGKVGSVVGAVNKITGLNPGSIVKDMAEGRRPTHSMEIETALKLAPWLQRQWNSLKNSAKGALTSGKGNLRHRRRMKGRR